LFGLQPWDVDRLTYGEVTTYLARLKAIADAQQPKR